MVYYVEVTATNINFTNTTTCTSQHITLTLQIGVEYSFRVRGADTINRLGDWGDPFVYISSASKAAFTLHVYNNQFKNGEMYPFSAAAFWLFT